MYGAELSPFSPSIPTFYEKNHNVERQRWVHFLAWLSSRRAFNKERKIKSDEHSKTIILMFCAYLVVQNRIIFTVDVYLRHGLKIIILI